MMAQLLNSSKNVVAIGECGLDYDRLEFCPKEKQIESFKKHLELSKTIKKPFFFHNRNSTLDFVRIVREYRDSFSSGVVHSFTGNTHELKEILSLDLYIGINGCSLKNKEQINVIREIPLTRLMIETDAPWCSIRPTHAAVEYIENLTFDAVKKEKFEFGKQVVMFFVDKRSKEEMNHVIFAVYLLMICLKLYIRIP
jgi:TatD DNase family protein